MNLERLHALAVETELAGQEMANERQRSARLAGQVADGTAAPRVVTSFNLFQTPPEVAARMAAMLPAGAGRILEPSAGLGRLYLAGRARCPRAGWALVDESPACARELYRLTEGGRGVLLKQGDFLGMTTVDLGGQFDAVIMNPPFERGRDVKHILHAAGMLATGGLLVGLCYDGATQARLLRPFVDLWEPLPAGSFRSEGTGAGVVLVTIEKK